jgi:hypothetical protein
MAQKDRFLTCFTACSLEPAIQPDAFSETEKQRRQREASLRLSFHTLERDDLSRQARDIRNSIKG